MPVTSEHYVAVVNQAGVGLAEVTLTGEFILVNPAYCQITGRSRDELMALRMQDITHPEDLPGNLLLFEECITAGRGFTISKRYVRPDGTTVWVENTVSLVRGADGAPHSILAVSNDITQRKAAELAVLEAEERYRLVGRATNDVIWDWDRRTGLVSWSESLQPVFGYPPEEATGPIDAAVAWWGERIHPDEREAVVASFLETARSSGDLWAKEYRFRAADGSYRHVIDRGYIARDPSGEPSRMLGSMQDITKLRLTALERERLVGELDAERRKLETVLQHLPAGVIVAEASGRLVFANQQVERIWRHPFLAARTIADLGGWKGFTPDGTPLAAEEWPLARALVRGEVVTEQIIHFERGDGSGRGVMQAQASPIVDASGAVVAGVVVFTDVTERERAYEMARQAKSQAEAANRLKDEFLAILSHELRTPLNAILGWAHMAGRDNFPAARVPQALTVIERNARAQLQMIEDLLDVSAIVRDKLTVQREPLDLHHVVTSTVESFRPGAEQKGVAIEVELDPAARSASGDAARLQQVVWNLVSNALKFTPAGGRVDVLLQRASPGEAELTVRDNGIGIAPAFLPFVFERFRQGDATATRSHGGLGLGLSIVHHLVTAHGGTIRVESEGLDRGTVFVARLPVLTP